MQFDIEEFVRLFGSEKASRVLSTLGRKEEKYKPLLHPEVQPLLMDTMRKWEYLLVRIIRDEATDKEKMEFCILDDFLTEGARKILDYRKELAQVMEDSMKAELRKKR